MMNASDSSAYGGTTAALVCVARGYPIAPSIVWEFNETVVINDTSCRVSPLIGLYRLL